MKILSLFLLLLTTQSFAQQDAKMEAVLQMVLNQVSASSMRFQFEGAFDSKSSSQIELLKIDGMLKFKESVTFDLIPDAKANSQTGKLIPKFVIGTKDLILHANFSQTHKTGTFEIKFYSHFDHNLKKWVEKPLTFQTFNQLSTQLVTVRLHSINVRFNQLSDNTHRNYTYTGSCKSDQEMLNFETGKLQNVDAQCEFSGLLSSQQGNQLRLKYK